MLAHIRAMNWLVVALMVAGAMPYALTLASKWGKFGRRDNHRTRDWQASLEGWRKRAHWAHENAFEAFPVFAVGVLLNIVRCPDCDGGCATIALAWVFVAARIGYSFAYIFDRARIRSLLWFAAVGCSFLLYVQAISGCCAN